MENDILNSFYDNERELDRLSSKSGAIEFIISTTYIEKYLQSGNRIIEIGAGTGKYSLHYAHKGFEVDAVELVQSNVDILKRDILPTDNINAVQGNALDLSRYGDNTFDITMVLGPMYHLYSEKDKLQCINEAIRVTKKLGVIFVAYCQFDAAMIQTGFMNNRYNFLLELNVLDEKNYLPISKPEAIFELYRKEQVEKLMSNFNVKSLHYVGTDMFSHYMRDVIDNMDEDLYKKYIQYTLTICENQNLVGVSNHTLDIFQKL